MKTNILQRIILCMTMGILPLQFVHSQTSAGSPCNRHYESAIKFIVDTPVVHKFSVSRTGNKKNYVIFSPGNLQYCPSYQQLVPNGHGGQQLQTITDVFRFAPRQIDRCTDGGNSAPANGNVYYTTYVETAVGSGRFNATRAKSSSCKNQSLGPKYHGWIDLFNWGTSCQGRRANDPCDGYYKPYDIKKPATGDSNNPTGFGPSGVTNIDTNSGSNRYFDWGYANIIQEYKTTTDAVTGVTTVDSNCYRPGVWRTLTMAEWQYLLNTNSGGGVNDATVTGRKVERSSDVWSLCSVEDPTITTTGNAKYIAGILLYPDDFDSERCGVTTPERRNFSSSNSSDICHAAANKISWANFLVLEENGCIFLPSACSRDMDGSLAATSHYVACRYWSSSANSASLAYRVYWDMSSNTANINPTATWDRRYGMSVRLVQDVP